MDNKITKQRLKNFLIYDLFKVVAVCIAVCFGIVILFNVVETKPTKGQQFCLLFSDDVIIGEESGKIVEKCAEEGFSHEILDLTLRQVESGDQGVAYYLGLYTELNQDDILFCTDTYAETYLKNGNAQSIIGLNGNKGLVEKCKDYLIDSGYYTQNGEICEQKIVEDFLKRAKKDKRFKTSKQIEDGKISEIKRIKSYWDNAEYLTNVFNAHPEIFSDKYTSFTFDKTYYGHYAINLGKLVGGADIFNAFQRKVTDEEGNSTYTSDGVYIMVGDNYDVNGAHQYEALGFIVSTIKTYSNF